jgi:hypothetical protein
MERKITVTGGLKMVLKEIGIEGIKKDLRGLDEVMLEFGFYRAWDYYSAHYDFRYEDPATNLAFFLRVPAEVVQGVLESPTAVLQLDTPFLGRHLFPHGIDTEFNIPEHIVEAARNKLELVKAQLTA